MKILVTGGAGYIGSATTKRLLDLGHSVIVLDNLQKGKKRYVDKRAIFYKIDLTDLDIFKKVLKGKHIDVAIHFAALKSVEESMENQALYFKNLQGLMNLIEVSHDLNIKKIVFSSSAAVYGEPQQKKIKENHICNPNSFYGYTKLAGEELLSWARKIYKIDYVCLRYFNVAGDSGLNYIDSDAKNIFNIICEVIFKNRKKITVFGNDYKTRDGTGIRDYIHIDDIVEAHIKALGVTGSHTINLGTGKGSSVLEIIKQFEHVSDSRIPYTIANRRKGDVASVVSSFDKAKTLLGWKPKRNLEDMVKSAYLAYSKNRK